MAATPKPARKKIKKESHELRKALNNPKHGLNAPQKKALNKQIMSEVKERHNRPKMMARFKKKHPGEVYEP